MAGQQDEQQPTQTHVGLVVAVESVQMVTQI